MTNIVVSRLRLPILTSDAVLIILRTFCLALLVFALPTLGAAQTTSATLSGTVMDHSGAVVTDARIEVSNSDTGVRVSTLSNKSGVYVVTGLIPGRYRMAVTKEGFKSVVVTDVNLNVQDVVSRNFNLDVGALSETVTVTADEMNVNTTDASVSTVVDQTYVKNMPLNGRSFQDLILLTPGVVTNTPQNGTCVGGCNGKSGEFSVNGQRTEENYYTVDGVSANVGATADLDNVQGPGGSGSVAGATALGTTQALVSVDELQEFRVQSSTYSAEYGRNPGGQFAFETKSGTNQWHGTAYDYVRNGYFDAQDWFNDYFQTPEPALRQNDFGGTVGGPVRIPHVYNGKDRTFFFASYEGLRLTAPQPPGNNLVPDVALRNSAPAALQPALDAFPLPSKNGQDMGDGMAQYLGTWSNPSSIDSTSVRFDHVIREKMRLFFRFNNTNSDSATRGTWISSLTPSMVQTNSSTTRTYTAGITSLFSSRLSSDFRVNYTSNVAVADYTISPIGGSTQVDLRQLSGLSAGSGAVLYLCYDQCNALLQGQPSGAQRQWNFVETMSFSLGRHQLKFGGDYRRLAPYGIPQSPFVAYDFLSESDAESNNPYAYESSSYSGYPLYRNFSAFVADEWRVSNRLNLSMGLRWEVNPAPGVTQGLMPYTVRGSSFNTLTLAPQGTPLWKTTWYNFAPRLGAAYTLRGTRGRETVIRAGGGVFFDTGQHRGGDGFGGIGFRSDSPFGQTPFPINASALSTQYPITQPDLSKPPFSNVTGFYPHLQLPYTLQWNASIEQSLGGSQAFTISYVGSHGSRLLATNSYQTNSNLGFFTFVENGLTSDFQSLQLQFRRRLSRGITALGSYTWSHCLDYGSFNNFFGYNRGSCDYDVRHNFSAALSYDIPKVGHNAFVNAVLHHWGLDDRFTVRTAFPITLQGQQLEYPNGKLYDEGLSFVKGQPVYLYGANCASVFQALGGLQAGQGCPGGKALNPNAFIDVANGLGDTPRNFARLFGAWQMDLAVRREFPLYERMKLQFRAESFNIFNHPNFGQVFPYCYANFDANGNPLPGCTGTFGLAAGTLATTLGVLNPLYQMGGPRSMQFALKLVF